MLPSTLDFMWPMHQQSLMLLHPMVKEKMHLQEKTLFDLDLWVSHWKCCPVPSTSCDLCTYRVWSCYVKALGGEAFTRKLNIWPRVKVSRNVVQYPLHHVTNTATKFEAGMTKGLGGETFTRKYIIWSLTLTSYEMLPSTLYIMYPLHHVPYLAPKFEVATSKGFRGDAFTKKFNIWHLT